MARALPALLLLLFFLAPAVSGCFLWTTRGEGDALKKDNERLRQRMEQLDAHLLEEQQRLTEMIDRARSDVEKLEEMLTRATRVLARNSADFGAELESAKDKLREASGGIAELRHELEQLATLVDRSDRRIHEFALAAGLDLPVDEGAIPATADGHFDAIKGALAAGRHGEVRSLGKIFHERYPKDQRCDDVQLLIAKSHLEQKQYAKGLGALRRFTDLYPKSELTPEVLYEMAQAFLALGDCTDARVLADAIIAKHPGSPFAEKARKLKEQMDKNKSRCTS
jgi:TolA-binding protein